MKKYIICVVFYLSLLSTYAQYKGNPNKARSYTAKVELSTDIDEIKNLLTDAKGEIDAAILIEKNKYKADIKEKPTIV